MCHASLADEGPFDGLNGHLLQRREKTYLA